MDARIGVLVIFAMGPSASAQSANLPQFNDFPVGSIFKGRPATPVLTTPQERRYRTVIRGAVSSGSGVIDGITGEDLGIVGPNFAGHFAIVRWGCGSPCLMAAIVNLKTGRVFPPPFHHGPGDSYFQVPWAYPLNPPLSYRLDSRLLIANICEALRVSETAGQKQYEGGRCGTHYFLMGDDGLKLIRTVLKAN